MSALNPATYANTNATLTKSLEKPPPPNPPPKASKSANRSSKLKWKACPWWPPEPPEPPCPKVKPRQSCLLPGRDPQLSDFITKYPGSNSSNSTLPKLHKENNNMR
ncbi:hypothetical protein E2C01_007823 [Portunus trituberculatus]|uniref:Uncharacterized protein n=1 Tax=Portunus trituberculatus TaxID=210409 RepID=A0A5B7D006_PORTR|nr:hypothetical protein [Portunus trituberculatus]